MGLRPIAAATSLNCELLLMVLIPGHGVGLERSQEPLFSSALVDPIAPIKSAGIETDKAVRLIAPLYYRTLGHSRDGIR